MPGCKNMRGRDSHQRSWGLGARQAQPGGDTAPLIRVPLRHLHGLPLGGTFREPEDAGAMAAARTRAASKGEEHGSEGRTGRGGPGSLLPLMTVSIRNCLGPSARGWRCRSPPAPSRVSPGKAGQPGPCPAFAARPLPARGTFSMHGPSCRLLQVTWAVRLLGRLLLPTPSASAGLCWEAS